MKHLTSNIIFEQVVRLSDSEKWALCAKRIMVRIHCQVASGLGNASGNFRQNNVDKKIAGMLGWKEMFPGTLNLLTEKPYADYDNGKYDGFIDASEYNGNEWIKIKRCKVNGFECAIIRPLDHFNVDKFKKRIEVISFKKLRNQLNLEDGD